MAVAFRSIATAGPSLSATSINVSAPAGLANDDIVVLRVTILNASFSGSTAGVTITPPAGFTLRNRTDWDPGYNATGASTAIFTKLAASEGSSYTTNFSGNMYCDADVTAVTGGDVSSGSAHFDSISGNVGTSTTATSTSINVARNGSLLFFFSASSNNAPTNNPTGFTQRALYDTNIYTGTSAANAGATGALTQSFSPSQNWVVQVLSIQPPGAGGAIVGIKPDILPLRTKPNISLPPFWPPSQIPRSTVNPIAPSLISGDIAITNTFSGTLLGTGSLTGDITESEVFSGTLFSDLPVTGRPKPNPIVPSEFNRRLPPFWPPSQIPRSTQLPSSVISNISGDIAVTNTFSGTLIGFGVIVSNIPESEVFSGNLLGNTALQGSIIETSSFSGTLLGTGNISGDITESEAFSGTIIGIGNIVADIAESEVFSGTIIGTGNMGATCTGILTFSGSTTGTGSVIGSIAATETFSSTLLGTGSLSGDIACTETFDGTLINSAAGAATGNISCLETFNGTITASGILQGDIPSIEVFSGTIIGNTSLQGDIQENCVFNGSLTGTGTIIGSIIETSTFTGTLTGIGSLIGSFNEVEAFSGTLINNAPGALQGDIGTSCSVSGTLTGTGNILGAINSVEVFSGNITGLYNTSGDIVSFTSISGTLQGIGSIIANIATDDTFTGTLTNASTGPTANINIITNLVGTLEGIGNIISNIPISSIFTLNNAVGPVIPTRLIYGTITDSHNTSNNTPVIITLVSVPTYTGVRITKSPLVIKTDNIGYFELDIIQGAIIEIYVPFLSYKKTVTVTSNIDIMSLI